MADKINFSEGNQLGLDGAFKYLIVNFLLSKIKDYKILKFEVLQETQLDIKIRQLDFVVRAQYLNQNNELCYGKFHIEFQATKDKSMRKRFAQYFNVLVEHQYKLEQELNQEVTINQILITTQAAGKDIQIAYYNSKGQIIFQFEHIKLEEEDYRYYMEQEDIFSVLFASLCGEKPTLDRITSSVTKITRLDLENAHKNVSVLLLLLRAHGYTEIERQTIKTEIEKLTKDMKTTLDFIDMNEIDKLLALEIEMVQTKANEIIERKDKELEAKDQALEQKDQALEQKDQALEQNAQVIEANAQVIENLILTLYKELGYSIEQLSAKYKLSIAEIQKMINGSKSNGNGKH